MANITSGNRLYDGVPSKWVCFDPCHTAECVLWRRKQDASLKWTPRSPPAWKNNRTLSRTHSSKLSEVNRLLACLHRVMSVTYRRSHSLFYLLVHSRCRGCLFSLDHTHDTHHLSVGLLWTRDRPVAETSTWQHKHCTRQTSMPPVGFEPTIPASARQQTYALDRAATGIGECYVLSVNTVELCPRLTSTALTLTAWYSPLFSGKLFGREYKHHGKNVSATMCHIILIIC
jgi:hypothetical protein